MRNFIFLLVLSMACENPSANLDDEQDKAQQVVNKAIENAGGENFNNAIIDFDFRDHHYQSNRNNGIFLYSRIKKDSTGIIHDMLGNDGFTRMINGHKVEVPDSMAVKYSNSVNSVIYFSLLPYGLNDPAVRKKYLGEVEIKGKNYHKIKVTFAEEGGGEDFEDIYIYWIGKDNYNVDYLAYEFHVNGGGQRFRKAVNPRVVNKIRFVDYINYKPEVKGVAIEKTDSLYLNNRLEQVSEINLRNVEVNYNK